jgi:hypothetical protein
VWNDRMQEGRSGGGERCVQGGNMCKWTKREDMYYEKEEERKHHKTWGGEHVYYVHKTNVTYQDDHSRIGGDGIQGGEMAAYGNQA